MTGARHTGSVHVPRHAHSTTIEKPLRAQECVGRSTFLTLPRTEIDWNQATVRGVFSLQMHLQRVPVALAPTVQDPAVGDPSIERAASEPTESEMVARALARDESAWVDLIRGHQQAIFRLAWLLLADRDEAEEVAQETFLRAWFSLERFDSTRPLRPWLLRIAHNLALNRRRSLRRSWQALVRFVSVAAGGETSIHPQEKLQQSANADALWHAVRRLSQADQQIVYLRYFLELSVDECADTLEIAPGTVKSRLYRALERLRPLLEREFGEDS